MNPLRRLKIWHFAAISALALTMAIVYFGPIFTFGGRYHHNESGSTYEFRDGRFYENGKDLGQYSVQIRRVRIDLDTQWVDEPIYASIGWNAVKMRIPKYGMSVLTRKPNAPSNNSHGR